MEWNVPLGDADVVVKLPDAYLGIGDSFWNGPKHPKEEQHYRTQPELQGRVGVDSNTLASATAEQAFLDADLNHDGKISFEEFKRWYALGGEETLDNLEQTVAMGMDDEMTLDLVRELTGLPNFDVSSIVGLFNQAQNDMGLLDRNAFYQCFRRILEANPSATESKMQQLDMVLEKLFGIFDEDGSGYVDYTELMSGLTVLCGGDRDDKVRAAFALFDQDGDGYITRDEMYTYLASVFRVLYETNPNIGQHINASVEELAMATTDQAFEDNDIDNDGRISFAEFTQWYTTSGAFGSDPNTASQSTPAAPSEGMTMQEARRLLNLDKFSLQDLLQVGVPNAPIPWPVRATYRKLWDSFVRCHHYRRLLRRPRKVSL